MENTKKKRELRLPAKASVWYVGSAAVVKLVGVITTPIFTRVLSEVEYGSFTFYMSFAAIITSTLSTVFSPAIIYKGLEKFSERRGAYVRTVYITNFIVLSAICILLFAFHSFLDLKRYLILLLFLQIGCDLTATVYETRRRYEYDYMPVVRINLCKALISPILSLLLLFFADMGYFSRVFGQLFASLAVAIPLFKRLFYVPKDESFEGLIGYSLRQSAPMLPLAVTSAVSGGADKIIMNKALGSAALAKYSVAYTLGISLSFITGALSSALTPWAIRKLSQGRADMVKKIGTVLLRGISGASVFVIALAPEALEILAPNRYSEAVGAVLPITLSILPSFLYTYSSIGLIHRSKAGITSVGALGGLLINLISNLFLIPRLGYVGGGIALLISSVAMAAVNIFFLSLHTPEGVIDRKSCSLTILLTAALGLLSVLLYEYVLPRILLLIIPLIMILRSLFEARRYITE